MHKFRILDVEFHQRWRWSLALFAFVGVRVQCSFGVPWHWCWCWCGSQRSFGVRRRWSLTFVRLAFFQVGVDVRDLFSIRRSQALVFVVFVVFNEFNVFNVQRHLISCGTLRVFRDQAMLAWRQATVAA